MSNSNSFSFSLPTRIEYGAGKADTLVAEVAKLGGKKPFVITDKGLIKTSMFKKILGNLEKSGLAYGLFSDVESNPRDTTIKKAVAILQAHNADLIIAIGGGSSMDTAKAVGMLVTNGGEVHDYFGVGKVKKPALPLIAVPTTAGTGSEVSIWSIVTDTRKPRFVKNFFGSPLVCPTVAIVDPLLTIDLPPHLTAYTGMDALSHAIECYVGLLAQPIADATALLAIKLITRSLVPATMNGANLQARDDVMLGSLLAGVTLTNTDGGAIHCLGHSIGGLYDVHHGLAMAIFFPYVMDYNLGATPNRFADIAEAMGENIGGLSPIEAGRKSIDRIVEIERLLRIPTLRETGVKEEDFQEIAEMSLADSTSEANPRKMTVPDMVELLQAAFADRFGIATR